MPSQNRYFIYKQQSNIRTTERDELGDGQPTLTGTRFPCPLFTAQFGPVCQVLPN